jgi:hypothetical protein
MQLCHFLKMEIFRSTIPLTIVSMVKYYFHKWVSFRINIHCRGEVVESLFSIWHFIYSYFSLIKESFNNGSYISKIFLKFKLKQKLFFNLFKLSWIYINIFRRSFRSKKKNSLLINISIL